MNQKLPEGVPKLTKEMQKKMDELKKKMDDFKKKVLEKLDKYVVGIALMPPEKPKPGEKEDPKKINILVMVDDSDSKKMSKNELVARLTQIIDDVAAKVDKNFYPEVMLTSELKEACYDAKYELLKIISMSAPVYDPADLLAAVKIAEVHKSMTIKKFEKYIVSYVAAGSLFRGEKSNDIDVYVIVDDTDVKKMSRAELKDKLRAIIVSMGFEASKITGVKKQFHVQTYILTDFWDNIKEANPVIFTLLRDGVPLYDRGVFMPWKLLLQMGRIKPSPEAIDMNMDLGERLLTRIKHKMLSVVGEDLYYAVLNPAQAALMLYGIPPPTPKETIKLLEEIFVKKEKLLEKKYVEILAKIRKAYKDIEHGNLKEVTGTQIDKLLKDAEDYLKRIKKMFAQIEEKTQKESIVDAYETCVRVAKDYLQEAGVEKVSDAKLETLLKEYLVNKEKMPQKFIKLYKNVKKAKKDYIEGKLSKQEANKAMKDARIFIKTLVEQIQRKKAIEMEKAKVRFKYDKDQVGEVVFIGSEAFIVKNLQKREDLLRAKVSKDGSLTNVNPCKPEDYEKAMTTKKPAQNIYLNQNLFESLKNIIEKEIEILLR
ncbi:HEPN domain-containing protein [Candidatus Woesearchaeota archaeon]|nr:MAG: HEPN domain-containing protein [Candidatus Woesearchaeota archaeon]